MIRLATPLDLLALNELAQEYAKEVGEHSDLDYDVDKAMQMASYSLHSHDFLLLVYVRGGEIVGFIWACAGPFMLWSSDIVAMDNILYVKPEHRGSLAGVSLIRAYLKWAKAAGAKEARISCGSGIHEERTNALYERLGFQRVGAYHRRSP